MWCDGLWIVTQREAVLYGSGKNPGQVLKPKWGQEEWIHEPQIEGGEAFGGMHVYQQKPGNWYSGVAPDAATTRRSQAESNHVQSLLGSEDKRYMLMWDLQGKCHSQGLGLLPKGDGTWTGTMTVTSELLGHLFPGDGSTFVGVTWIKRQRVTGSSIILRGSGSGGRAFLVVTWLEWIT